MHRILALISIVAAVVLQGIAADWSQEYVKSLFDGRRLAPVEGVWQFGGRGAVMAIVKSGPTEYDIILIDSPRLGVAPGTVIGHAEDTPKQNVYDAHLDAGKLGGKPKLKSQSMVLTVNDNGTLSVEPYRTGYSVSFKRWLSYMLRITVTDHSNERPKGLTGARRLYPYRLSDHYPVYL